jgi:hypothetical protein
MRDHAGAFARVVACVYGDAAAAAYRAAAQAVRRGLAGAGG